MSDYFYSESSTPHCSPLQRLYDNRIVALYGPIDDAQAYRVTVELMCLDEESHAPILLLINSPGGSISAGFAIIDTMNTLGSAVYTRAVGMAASMAAVVLAMGTHGERSVMPNAEVLIHQPLMQGGVSGQATDIAIAAEAIIKKRTRLNILLAEATGRTVDEIAKATDRDNWMTAQEAIEFGIADRIVKTARKGN